MQKIYIIKNKKNKRFLNMHYNHGMYLSSTYRVYKSKLRALRSLDLFLEKNQNYERQDFALLVFELNHVETYDLQN
jgi:hypothetical protein